MLAYTYQPGTEPGQPWGLHHATLGAIRAMDHKSHLDHVSTMINTNSTNNHEGSLIGSHVQIKIATKW